MAEEQRWQDRHRLCANNCGFFGSPATLDLCSKCYRDTQQQPAAPAAAFQPPPPSAPVAACSDLAPSPPAPVSSGKAPSGWCACCRKRVGLTGFACRCGATFCGVHRYPERHTCAFDFRAAGRDAIARANPVVKGDKLKDKI